MYTELFNPIYGTVDGLPVIVLGAITSTELGSAVEWVVADDDGAVRTIRLGSLRVDIRFREGRWADTSPGALDEEA